MGNIITSDKRLQIALHIVLWMIIFIFPIYIFHTFGFNDIRQLSHFYVNAIAYGLIFYVNYLYLGPRFYFNRKKWQYFLVVTGLIIVLFFLIVLINDQWLADHEKDKQFEEIMKKLNEGRVNKRPPFELFRVINYLFTSLMITGFALGLGFMERYREDEKKRKELEKEKLHSELAFLKNQISPHFFFNTLNNIYALTGIDTPAAQESILKLSKLMRYLLYESEHGETYLSHEIDFMTNYIALMKLRLSPKVDLKVSFPVEYIDMKVPPLLFVSFIENAFKHGISNRDVSFIDIRMHVEKERVSFYTENSIGKNTQLTDKENSGIGLENVKKRLALLFPERYQLSISQTEQLFKVELTIKLKNQEV
jgi:two-component system, LytTR family, sensor kinase